MRAIVILPVLAAVIGEVSYRLFALTPWGIAIAATAVLVAQHLLRRSMPPALAIAVLAMLLRAQGPYYPLDVAVSTSIIAAVFFLWRALVWRRLPASRR